MAKLTVLRVSEHGKQAAKTFALDEAGQTKKTVFNAGTWFHYSQLEVEGIHELSATLHTLAQDSQSLIIREELAKGKAPTALVRRLGIKGHPDDGFFCSVPAGVPWVLLDFDGIPCPTGIDFIHQPKQAMAYLASLLPAYFHNVSFHYHLSSSAGLDGGKTIRAHLWYWLDHPVTDALIRIWAKNINASYPLIDKNLFNTVQPHYTADPIFYCVTDPFPGQRSGLISLDVDAVPFPTIVVEPYPAHALHAYLEGLTPTEKFKHFIAAVGDHDGGQGFHYPLLMASWFYVLENGPEGTDKAALKQKLKEAVLSADSSKHDEKSYIAKQASDDNLNELIDSALAKLSAPGKTSKIEGLTPHYQHDKVVSAAIATETLDALVKSYFAKPRHMGIRAGAGLGKTTHVIAGLAFQWQHGKKVELYVPTHKLADEVGGKLYYHPFIKSTISWIPKYLTGIKWQVIRGREYPSKNGDRYCLKSEIASQLSKRGIPVYPNLCRSGKQSCEYYGNCDYIKQFNGEWHVRVYPHSYLGLDRGFLDKEIPDYAVIDESFYQTLLVGTGPTAKPITYSEIKSAGWPAELTNALIQAPFDKPLLSYLRSTMGEDVAISCIDIAAMVAVAPPNIAIMGLSESAQLKFVGQVKADPRLDRFLAVLRAELVTGRDESHGIVFQPADQELGKQEGFLVRCRTSITRFSSLIVDADRKLTHLERMC